MNCYVWAHGSTVRGSRNQAVKHSTGTGSVMGSVLNYAVTQQLFEAAAKPIMKIQHELSLPVLTSIAAEGQTPFSSNARKFA
jgi:hypothetical protein